jgi:hypothetical protein
MGGGMEIGGRCPGEAPQKLGAVDKLKEWRETQNGND